MENKFQIKEINEKERITFHNVGNLNATLTRKQNTRQPSPVSSVWHLVLVYSDVGAVVRCVHSLLCSDSSSINALFPRLSVIICYVFFFFYLLEFFSLFFFFILFIYYYFFATVVKKKSVIITIKKILGTGKKMLRQQIQLKFKRIM